MQLTTSLRAFLAALACAALAALTGCGGGGGGSSSAAPDSSGGRIVLADVKSAKTGYSYPIQIYIPPSYETGNASYPTIYALDGDAVFSGTLNRFSNLKNILQRRGTNAILVGIGGTARRQTDFNFPGAYAYHAFIAQELIPYVESQFRADTRKRMLSGLSSGGNFAASALFIEAPQNLVFTYFLSAEGAFWQQPDVIQTLEQQMFDAVAGKDLPVTLILARGAAGNTTNAVYVDELYKRIAARRYSGMNLVETTFPLGHVEMDNPSFEDAIARILG
ncbi:alpha/beta hydrolase-fold protein [Xylophilus sp. GW821-FHT01B05]